MRSLVVMGSIPLNANDSINIVSGQTFISAETHWSGFWKIMDESGNLSMTFPDGTSLQIGPTSNIPSGHRVNNQGLRAPTVFSQSQLVSNTPSAFPLTLQHASGAEITIATNGDITLTNAGGAEVQLTGADVQLNP